MIGRIRAVWAGPQGRAALLVLLVMVVWRGVLVGGSSFNQDDYFFASRADASPLDLEFLFLTPNAGHVNPLQQLTFWLFVKAAPFGWTPIAVFLVASQALAVVVLWHLLSRLLPGRWVRVLLLAGFALAPLTLATTLWYAAAVCLWPHVTCSFAAVLFLVRERQGVGARAANLTGVVLAEVVGLLWHERAVLILPTLLAAAVLLEPTAGWRRVPRGLARLWGLWIGLLVLHAAFLLAHRAITTVEGGGAGLRESVDITGAYVGQNVLPGLLSGPWSARLVGGAVETTTWAAVLAAVLAAVVAVAVLRVGGPARRWAVAFLVLYVLADLTLVLAGRSGFGRVIGLDPRYSSDTLHAAVLAAAFALRDAPHHYGIAWRASWGRRRAQWLLGLGAAYTAGCVAGTAVLVPHFQNPADRAYVAAFRADLAADPQQVVVDALVPPEIVLPLVGDDALLSRVFAPLPEQPVFDQPSERMRVVTPQGRLAPVELAAPVPAVPGPLPGCGHPIRTTPRAVPLQVPVQGRLVAHVGYFTDREVVVVLDVAGRQQEFLARPGPHELWFVLPDTGAPVDRIGFRLRGADLAGAAGATVCLASLDVGLPVLP
ncbi:hypothetical protein [Nocardioides sp.]|uniref:hypothetical protein n=1 Tax=Nocardioides sp. TaxID=35761 RepID=UPI0035171062